MTPERFERLVESRLGSCLKKLLEEKRTEYARNNDRFHNFVRAAAMSNTTKENALWGMVVKHFVSIKDIIDDIAENKNVVLSRSLIDDKIDDAINYLLLLNAMFEDHISKSTIEEGSEH